MKDLLRRLRRLPNRPDPSAVYASLVHRLDPASPGRGRDIHTPEEGECWPSAFALVSSAEHNRYELTGEPGALETLTTCVRWLAGNVGCASTAAPCWGVPYPRRIWEDTVPAAKGTAFSVPTSHAIQALCEASRMPGFGDVERQAFSVAALAAATHFARACYDTVDDSAVLWYSPLRQHSFHVTNAAGLMLGQLQRASNLDGATEILRERADAVLRYLLARRRYDAQGFGWDYFGDRIPEGKANRTNDLLHEAFVCHGLLDYKEYGGNLGHCYSYDDLYRSLARFYRDRAFFEFCAAEPIASRKKPWARVWAVGHALYVTSRLEPKLREAHPHHLGRLLFEQLRDYYFAGDELLYRPGQNVVTDRVREVGHVLLGLSGLLESED